MEGAADRIGSMISKALSTRRGPVFTNCRTQDPEMNAGAPRPAWNGAAPMLPLGNIAVPMSSDVTRSSGRTQSKLTRLTKAHPYSSPAMQSFVECARSLPLPAFELKQRGKSSVKRQFEQQPFDTAFDANEYGKDDLMAARRVKPAKFGRCASGCGPDCTECGGACASEEQLDDGLKAVYAVPVPMPAPPPAKPRVRPPQDSTTMSSSTSSSSSDEGTANLSSILTLLVNKKQQRRWRNLKRLMYVAAARTQGW